MATNHTLAGESANSIAKNATLEENSRVNTEHRAGAAPGSKERTEIMESKFEVTGRKLIRWAGIPAVLAGAVFAGIQPIHPTDALSSVNTTAWAIITPMKTVMCLFFMLGLTGIYARQVNRAGWLGLAGYLLFGLSWAVNLAYIFAEAFILPPLSTAAPGFAQDFIYGVITGRATDSNLGALPAIFQLNGLFYLLGGLLFGTATFRAGILSRIPATLLAVTALLTPLAALFPHEMQRYAGIPVGVAVAWLGYSVWSEKRAHSSEEQVSPAVPGQANTELSVPTAR